MNIIKWIRGWFHRPKYRIIYIDGIGYVAQYYLSEFLQWQPIEPDGSTESTMPIVRKGNSGMSFETKEEAGAVINLHSQKRNGRIIWIDTPE